MITLEGEFAKANIMIDNVEPECIAQIYTFLNHPMYKGCNIVVMPDCHFGIGSVVGMTMHIVPEICPNIVGKDIGCGMLSIPLQYLPNQLPSEMNVNIRKVIPLGFNCHTKNMATMEDRYSFSGVTVQVNDFIKSFNKMFNTDHELVTIDYSYYKSLCEKVRNPKDNTVNKMLNQVDSSIGTLGGGNHFIEIGEDSQKCQYVTVHTGSRNFGNRVADYFQKKAEKMDYNKINNRDLAYLKGEDAMEYYIAMNFVQRFAEMNREVIMWNIRDAIETPFDSFGIVESIHNHIDFHDMILRKGAISSYKDKRMVIPFNMRDGIALCEGKSNPDWNYSAPHGAGRVLSRNKAKKLIDPESFKKQMVGIYSTSVGVETLDEAPDAYKPMQIILDAIEPTATIIDMIKPILNIKG